MNTEKYINFINSHPAEAGKAILKEFVSTEEKTRNMVICKLKSYLIPTPEHFVRESDDCDELTPDGLVSLDQTVYQFLEDEYISAKKIPYADGREMFFTTYGNDFTRFSNNIVDKAITDGLKNYLEDNFKVSLSENDVNKIQADPKFDYGVLLKKCPLIGFLYVTSFVKEFKLDTVSLSDILKEPTTEE